MKYVFGLVVLAVFVFFTYGNVKANQVVNSANSVLTFRTVQDTAKTKKQVKKETVKKPVKKENIGIGPVKELKLGPINKAMVSEGKNIFNSKCFACHRLDSKLVGPALIPIVKKTNPVYLMNYLLNTTEMQKKEPELKKLIKEFNGVVMPDQDLNKKQARSVLEYLRSNIKGK